MSYFIVILIFFIVLNLIYAIPYLKIDKEDDKNYSILFTSLKYLFEELESEKHNRQHTIRTDESVFKFNALNQIILGNYYHKKNLNYILIFYNNSLKNDDPSSMYYIEEWAVDILKDIYNERNIFTLIVRSTFIGRFLILIYRFLEEISLNAIYNRDLGMYKYGYQYLMSLPFHIHHAMRVAEINKEFAKQFLFHKPKKNKGE